MRPDHTMAPSLRPHDHPLSRRNFLAAAALAGGGLTLGVRGATSASRQALAADRSKALIAITLDMEMSRNFPAWENTHWDYEKGNLNAPTKQYCVEAARRVKAKGGVIHFFAVGRVLEQENVEWLQEIARAGHPIGNHTYDHVYVLAKQPEDVQFRFKRAPWLLGGKTAAEAIRENIRMTTDALKTRVGVDVAGFRTPGGFDPGLSEREDVQRMLLDLGFDWISCKAPKVNTGPAGTRPTRAVFDAIVKASMRLADCTSTFLFRREGNAFRTAANAYVDAQFVRGEFTDAMPIDPAANFPSRVFTSKTMLHIPDWSAIELPPFEQLMQQLRGLRATLMVPLMRSFVMPLIIMATVPLGLIGVLVTLWTTGTTLNIQSEMGVIFLVGIIVSQGVLLMVNPAAADVLGGTPESLLGRALAEFIDQSGLPEFAEYLERVMHARQDEGTLLVRALSLIHI